MAEILEKVLVEVMKAVGKGAAQMIDPKNGNKPISLGVSASEKFI